MRRIEISIAARADLDSMWDELNAVREQTAEMFLQQLDQLTELLAKQPLIGRLRQDLAEDLRVVPVNGFRYLLFYQIERERIVVVRILHGSRDLPSLF